MYYKWLFWTKFETLEDHFFKELDISTAKYKKNTLNTVILIMLNFFIYLPVLYVNLTVKGLKFGQK